MASNSKKPFVCVAVGFWGSSLSVIFERGRKKKKKRRRVFFKMMFAP